MRVNVVPVHQWTHREFVAPDPWAGHQPVHWTVAVYKMLGEAFIAVTPVSPQSVPPQSNNIPAKLAVGIHNRQHNRYRVLPLAVQDLFRAGQVQDHELPWLLHQIEEPLTLNDYPPGAVPLLMLIYAGMLGAVAVLSLFLQFVGMALGLACLAIFCLGVYLVLRQRRQSQREQWLALLRTAREAANSSYAAL